MDMLELKGLQAPPLVDGKFDIGMYRQWMTVNEYWPWMLLYADYREYLYNTSRPLSEDVFVRVDQMSIRMTQLKHWFDCIKIRIERGEVVPDKVLKDYQERLLK